MAIAKKCDRCGEFYTLVDESAIDTLVRNLLNLSKTQTQIHFERLLSEIDFCPECQHSLLKWFKNKTEGNNG